MLNKLIIILLFSKLLFAQSSNTIFELSGLNIKNHLNYLGSDLFEGRGTGTLGGELAAKYIAYHFNQYHLIPLGYNNTYYQYVPMHGSLPKPGSNIIIESYPKSDTLLISNDYMIYHSGGKLFAPNPIELVFVGYGITAPEFNYDDYENIDVDGKIVVFIDGEPTEKFAKTTQSSFSTIYAAAESKQRIALAHGAVGSILIPINECTSDSSWNKYKIQFDFEDVSLAYTPAPHLAMIVNPYSSETIFNRTGLNAHNLREFHLEDQITSFNLHSKVIINNKFKSRDFVSPNIIGMIEGSDEKLKDTYTIVTAHYDHLGIGPSINRDNIYNGMLDNSIGTAAVIELARLFSELKTSPKRSIIFMLVTGEEKGLLGSKYYTDHPLVRIEKTIAAVNIDGISIFDELTSIIGVGAEYSNLEKLLDIAAFKNNLTISNVPKEFNYWESFTRSDQLAFAQKGIPSILIAEGFTYKNKTTEEGLQNLKNYLDYKYHTPDDDLSIKINYNAVIQHLKIYYDFLTILSYSTKEPKWKENAPFSRE